MNRKQRRAAAKISKNQGSEKLSEKIFQFDQLPEECSACLKEYDKKNKQMAMTWNVVVKDAENTVRLYCPDCWAMAKNAIATLKEEIENASQ